MTNFYEELGLDRSKRIDEINAELSKLESTWKRREITNPEKATTMLALIIQARKVFASDATRRAYDTDLDNSLKKPEQKDPNKERNELLNKWIDQANFYYTSGQYDLAKVAVEKAISLSNINGDDDALFALAADIYRENADLQTAMSYINRAIVTAPEISAYYLSKGLIYDHQAVEAMHRGGYGNPNSFCAEARKMFQMADVKAEQSGDLASRARACGALAFSFYYQDPMDKQKGEDYANLAVKFGGDSWGNADKVLEEVKRIRDEQEEARRKKIYEEALSDANSEKIFALENAIKKLESLNGWKDSGKQIDICKNKIAAIKEKEKKEAEQAEKNRIRKKIFLKVLAMVAVVVVVAGVIFAIKANIKLHFCGDNVKWKLERDTLRIYGEGEIYDYPNQNAPWDDISSRKIQTILIEDGITYVGKYAFRSCNSVSNIILPKSLKYIASTAFCSYDPITIELPESLEVIESYAFDVDMTEIYIPASVKFIDSAAFGAMNELKNIIIDDKNQYYSSINGVLFNRDATALVEYPKGREDVVYTIPDSVEYVAYNAFDNSNIDEVYLGEKTDFSKLWRDPNLELLRDFSEKDYFAKNDISYYGVKNALMYPGLRNDEWSLVNVYAHPDSEIYSSTNGVLYSKDYSILYWFPMSNRNEYYDVPDGVTEIAPFAFYGFNGNNIKQISFPDTLKTIGDAAFDGNYIQIDEIDIPEGVTKIGFYAFNGCEDLTYIMLPSTLRRISAFIARSDVEIHYNGTVSDWYDKVTVYEFEGVKEVPILYGVICKDGVIEDSESQEHMWEGKTRNEYATQDEIVEDDDEYEYEDVLESTPEPTEKKKPESLVVSEPDFSWVTYVLYFKKEGSNIRSSSTYYSDIITTVGDTTTPLYFLNESELGLGSDDQEYLWYHVSLKDGTSGWVRADMISYYPDYTELIAQEEAKAEKVKKHVKDNIPDRGIFRITKDGLNIRELPTYYSDPVVNVASTSERIYFYGKYAYGISSDNEAHVWYEVYLDSGGVGWIRSDKSLFEKF